MRARKIIVVAQYYEPDESSTAAYTTEIARALTALARVDVLSGSSVVASSPANINGPYVRSIRNKATEKGALKRRLLLEALFAVRVFLCLLVRAGPDDVVFTVTSPFSLPYAVVSAAYLKGARSVLLLYDLYPEALIASGMVHPTGLIAQVVSTGEQGHVSYARLGHYDWA